MWLYALVLVLIALAAGCSTPEPPLPDAPLTIPSTPNTPLASATALPTAARTPSEPDILLTISVAARQSQLPSYDRSEWGGWQDADKDCQNTRHEVLIAESLGNVQFKDDRHCQVATGRWNGAYTGREYLTASDLDIDHMVPLANAHASGGWRWQPQRKAQFGNDLSYDNHLIAVQSAANRQKSAKGPEEWRPPLRAYWCQYATDWVHIKHHWGLTATHQEAQALQDMLNTCEHKTLLQTVPANELPAPIPTPPAPAENPSPNTELRHDPTGPDRDCADFHSWDEAQAFYIAAGGPQTDPHRLDADQDGIACSGLR